MNIDMERGRVKIVEGNKLLKMVLENFSILERIIYQSQEAPGNSSGIMMPHCFLSLAPLFCSKD
jgi:hypothetical protein